MRHLLYRYLSGIVAFALLVGTTIAVTVFGFRDLQMLVVIISIALSLIYFVQQQRLSELRLQRDLFKDFNLQYDKLNGLLAAIRDSSDQSSDLSLAEMNTLYDYFNLCGEEFFYYQEGYITRQIWKIWISGMKDYYANVRIRRVWESELEKGSYYGLTKKHLK